jgi:protein-disulfide isomerase
MKLATFLLAFVVTLPIFAQTKATPSASVDKAAIEAYLRHAELWVPQVTVTIDDPKPSAYLPGFSELAVHLSYQGQSKDEHYYVSQNGQSIIKGEVYNLGKSPFQSNLDQIKLGAQPTYGKAGAPVTIVVFGDFQCPVCKVEADVMRKNLVQNFPDKVQVYFKDFPLESIHPWARAASGLGRCVYKQDPQAFWKFHDWIYENQEGITPDTLNSKVMTWAGTAGVDSIQLGRCVEGKTADQEVAQSVAEGRAMGLSATPTVFINGRKFEGAIEWPIMQQLVQLEIDHQASVAKTTAKTDDTKCEETCVVNIPKIAATGKK